MSDEKKIGPGSVVRLKSGGPSMTVERATGNTGTGWWCTWFAEKTKVSDGFEEAALEKTGKI